MLEEKDTYSIEELFENLDISIRELAQKSNINEVTLARIRDGRPAHRSTVNKLLKAFSSVYERPFYLRKMTGVNVQVNRRVEPKAEQTKEEAIA